jgi:N-acetylglucosamine kinase-like BadF-type ATPase
MKKIRCASLFFLFFVILDIKTVKGLTCNAGSYTSGSVCDTCPINTYTPTENIDTAVCTSCSTNAVSDAGSSSCYCSNATKVLMGNITQMVGRQAQENAGLSVSISADGTVALVSVQGYDNGATVDVGTARAYKWNADTLRWDQMGSDEDMMGDGEYDYSGSVVSISADGTVALLGSPNQNIPGYYYAGGVRAYKWNEPIANKWNRLGPNEDMLGYQEDGVFGESVSISGDGTIALVTDSTYIYGASTHGTAKAYKWNGTRWNLLGSAEDMMGSSNEAAGTSVSISFDGTVAMVGSVGFTPGAVTYGTARVYKFNATANKWNLLGSASDMKGGQSLEYAGNSVSISSDGTVALVGARSYKNGGITYAGTARAYKWNTTKWNLLGSESDMQV